MRNLLQFCKRKPFLSKRYVFVDEEGIYYFWQFWSSSYAISLEIFSYKLEAGKFIEIETKKVEELVDYLVLRLSNSTQQEIDAFYKYIAFLEFTIPASFKKKFGEKLCYFLQDRDRKFIYQDPNAKHWIIDFEKVRNNEIKFLKEPDLLPFTITELGVTLTKDEKLTKDGKTITIDEFWNTVKEYKKGLIPLIKQKDKIMRKIEEDLKRRYFESLREIENKKHISDYEIEIEFEVFDTLNSDEPVLKILFTEGMFEDNEPYSLSLFGIDMQVGRLCWYFLDGLGLQSIQKKFFFWSEIKVRNQKFFEF